MEGVSATVSLEELDGLDPEELLKWAWDRHGGRAAIFTSFQNTGCVMIDMASRVAPSLRVVTIDTLRLHQDTYDLIARIESRYGIQIELFQPDPERLRRMLEEHGEFLFFDSKAKQEYCCQVRKVEPTERALATVDVWISGLRWDQSEFRKAAKKAAFIERRDRRVLKLCPLVEWSEEHVRQYVTEHNVPVNPLYDKGYTSIGCEICSTPTLPWESKRAGRWRWFNSQHAEDKKECGIHLDGSGI